MCTWAWKIAFCNNRNNNRNNNDNNDNDNNADDNDDDDDDNDNGDNDYDNLSWNKRITSPNANQFQAKYESLLPNDWQCVRIS